MKKNVGLTYVKNFEFPAEQGFTGSAGKSSVKGYMRGGAVKKTVGVTTKQSKQMPQKGVQKRAAAKSVKKAGGGSVHDQLYAAGSDMGYARGGRVKDTSDEFIQKSKPMASMDQGVQPARKGRNQADVEAGGTKRLKPKFKKGGGVHKTRPYVGKTSKHGGSKNSKACGGLMEYAEGGSVNSPMARDLGRGQAARAARGIKDREERVRSTVDEALKSAQASRSGGSPKPKPRVQDKPPQAAKRSRVYREDKGGVPTFTDVPKVGKRMGKRGAGR